MNRRPYICFAVNTLCQCMVEPRGVHLIETKHVMRHLKCTIDYGTRYVSDCEIILQGYTDSYWASSFVDWKITFGCCFSLVSSMISWFSRKQTSVVLSTAKVEYITVCSSNNEAVWIQKMLEGLFNIDIEMICIWYDNQSHVKLFENPVFHDKSKHIEIMYHYIRDMVYKGGENL
jgi:hypothetical protein